MRKFRRSAKPTELRIESFLQLMPCLRDGLRIQRTFAIRFWLQIVEDRLQGLLLLFDFDLVFAVILRDAWQ